MSTIKTKITDTIYFPSGNKVIITQTKSLDYYLSLTKNFCLWELANKKASDSVKAIWNEEVREHSLALQEFRDMIGVCNVNSWYRTKSFNAACGGASNSLHLIGCATDLAFPKMTDQQFNNFLAAWKSIGERKEKVFGINRYTNMIHLSSKENLFGYTEFVVRDYRKTSKDR